MLTPVQVPATPNETHFVRFRDRVRARSGRGELFVFVVGDERFAVDVRAVEEVLEAPEIQPIPGSSPSVAGAARYAGQVMAVVAAGPLLGVEGGHPRTVLVMRRGADRLGLLVDDVDDVAEIELLELRNPPYEADEFLLAVHWDGVALTSVLDARAVVAAAAAAVRGTR
ncbi:MAG: chemotaxis protein CheW [Gemmatimonadetes bacterium]|nr:chemotaxis protein CheW [Gemmatimonadota bacterium]